MRSPEQTKERKETEHGQGCFQGKQESTHISSINLKLVLIPSVLNSQVPDTGISSVSIIVSQCCVSAMSSVEHGSSLLFVVFLFLLPLKTFSPQDELFCLVFVAYVHLKIFHFPNCVKSILAKTPVIIEKFSSAFYSSLELSLIPMTVFCSVNSAL